MRGLPPWFERFTKHSIAASGALQAEPAQVWGNGFVINVRAEFLPHRCKLSENK